MLDQLIHIISIGSKNLSFPSTIKTCDPKKYFTLIMSYSEAKIALIRKPQTKTIYFSTVILFMI